MNNQRRAIVPTVLLGLLLVATGFTHAQTYPLKPIQIIVPQAPGGANDILARIVAEGMSKRLGQGVVVDNRPGAGGNIGTALAARATPDGYTLMMTTLSSQAINPALYPKAGFHPIADFESIGAVASVPNVLVANSNLPAKTLEQLTALAKTKPGGYQFGTPGNGTLNHLLGEMLNSSLQIELQHVPYKGVAAAMNDLFAGQIPLVMASLPSALPFIKAGRVNALAVTSLKRLDQAPDIPTVAEIIPGFSGDQWVGLFAPKATPKDLIDLLSKQLQSTLADPAIRQKLFAQGADIMEGSPEKLASVLKADVEKWRQIVKNSRVQID